MSPLVATKGLDREVLGENMWLVLGVGEPNKREV
jgi:hypothetical protein